MTLELTYVASLELAVLTSGDVKLDSRILFECLEALYLDLGIMYEQIISAFTGNESISLVLIEPLNSAFCHFLPFFLPNGQYTNDEGCSQETYITPYEPNLVLGNITILSTYRL